MNINYIITAEFHVDKGPSLLHQFPSEVPGINNLFFLPELMIPDQIHKRDEDFTLFMLFRNTTTGEFQYLNDVNCENEPYYVYTIVNNLKDDSVRRGSVIKSMSIITQLGYFKNFKPLMVIALDEYFSNTNISLLKNLYKCLNSKNFQVGKELSIVKKLLITSILDLPINDKIYYDEFFRNKLLEVESPNGDLFIRKDLSYNSVIEFSGMKIPVKIPLIELPDNLGDYLNPTDLNFKSNLIHILNSKLSSQCQNYDLTVYGLQTPSIILLINAILTGKKIMVLSYEHPSGFIIDFILTILKIVSGGGILSGILKNYNVFPILDVSKIDLLERCPHYLAGTINPFFKNNDALWDILYDLDTNEITISSKIDEGVEIRNSIISEDAKFLSNLQLSLFNYNDDLTTIQLILRRHINEIIRILISSKNYQSDNGKQILLLPGVGYHWSSDTTKLIEVSTYQSIQKKFNQLKESVLCYNLMINNLANELNLMIDIQYNLQKLHNQSPDERSIWFNILKYLISAKSLEVFLLMTYLIPPTNSSSLQSNSIHGGNLTIFDKNKGIELVLINLFNNDNQIKSNILMILQELNENFLCGWCLDGFIKGNLVYEMAFDDLSKSNLS
ncbi:hypothetical protein CLIB1444_23S00650 [[Candida] jaroonii]|uniref:Uncharacterized protein n=1 Tax=[Candida] jaroonii TaxID=467808 RepID=A0ACA9YGC4_9ASCO|nr:hypothetical protein CLIB1444_23S00650 [[Candida] jaroonii]